MSALQGMELPGSANYMYGVTRQWCKKGVPGKVPPVLLWCEPTITHIHFWSSDACGLSWISFTGWQICKFHPVRIEDGFRKAPISHHLLHHYPNLGPGGVLNCFINSPTTYRDPLFIVEDIRLFPRIPSYPFLIWNMQMTNCLSHGGCESSILLLSISAALTLTSLDQIQLRVFVCSFFPLDLSSSLKRSEHQAHPCSHYGWENRGLRTGIYCHRVCRLPTETGFQQPLVCNQGPSSWLHGICHTS
jgi:hypothetical protein